MLETIMKVEAGQIWEDGEDTYLIVGANEGNFNALKISRNNSLLDQFELLYEGAGVDEEVIREELTFTKSELAGVTTEVQEEDE